MKRVILYLYTIAKTDFENPKQQQEHTVQTSPVVAMLAAMCVRKTGDTSSQISSTQGGCVKDSLSNSTRKKHKSFKMVVGRKTSQTVKEKETLVVKDKEEERIPPMKVQDDEDGHLVYRKGDYLDSRCGY